VDEACQKLGFYPDPRHNGYFIPFDLGLERQIAAAGHADEETKIQDAMVELFPNIPRDALAGISRHAFQKVRRRGCELAPLPHF
jgi:hypothetical protein